MNKVCSQASDSINAKKMVWAFCRSCKKPILGMAIKIPSQNMVLSCGHCGAKNVFMDSSQPVAIQSDEFPSLSIPICTESKKD